MCEYPDFWTAIQQHIQATNQAWKLHIISNCCCMVCSWNTASIQYTKIMNEHVYSVFPLPALLTNKHSCWQYRMKSSQMISLINVNLLSNILETVSISTIRGWYEYCVSIQYLHTEQDPNMDSVGISRWSQLVKMNCDDWPTTPPTVPHGVYAGAGHQWLSNSMWLALRSQHLHLRIVHVSD